LQNCVIVSLAIYKGTSSISHSEMPAKTLNPPSALMHALILRLSPGVPDSVSFL